MRILVATDQWFPDVRGGLARVATETSRRLAARGHEVVVLAPRHAGAPAVEPDGSLRLLRVLRRSHLPQTLTDPAETRWHARRLGGRFDVLVAHNPTTAAGLAATGLGAPLVTVFHASAVMEVRFLRSRPGARRERIVSYALEPPLRWLERRAVRRAASVLVLSEFSRSLVLGAHPDAGRVRLVPGAVDTGVFAPGDRDAVRARLGLDPALPVLLTARRLAPRMGLEELLEAMALLRDSEPCFLAIAGAGSLHERLQRRRGKLGLEASVRLLGRISDDELADWYRAADLFVLPTAAYEGFGLVTAEALASGTPVVGTPVGATPELLEPLDPRLVMLGADARAVAEGIRVGLGLAGPALRERCRAYALERFDWATAIVAWEAAIAEVVEAPSQAGPPPETVPRGGPVTRLGRRIAPHVPFDLHDARDRGVAVAREGAAAAVRWSGAPVVARRLRGPRRAGILLYHNPDADTLERHLEYLARRHAFIRYDTLVEAVRSGDWREVSPQSLAVTLDDGHAGNARLLDVFERFGIVPTLFVCTQIVGTSRRFWFTLESIDRDGLMLMSNADRLAVLERTHGFANEREYVDRQALSRDELSSMSGRVNVQAHTRFHPVLPRCDDATCEREIVLSKSEVEAITGRPCRHFSYPNGLYGPRELALVRSAGFASARSSEIGWNDPDTDPYRLKVLGMPDAASLNLVAAQVASIAGLRELMYVS